MSIPYQAGQTFTDHPFFSLKNRQVGTHSASFPFFAHFQRVVFEPFLGTPIFLGVSIPCQNGHLDGLQNFASFPPLFGGVREPRELDIFLSGSRPHVKNFFSWPNFFFENSQISDLRNPQNSGNLRMNDGEGCSSLI